MIDTAQPVSYKILVDDSPDGIYIRARERISYAISEAAKQFYTDFGRQPVKIRAGEIRGENTVKDGRPLNKQWVTVKCW